MVLTASLSLRSFHDFQLGAYQDDAHYVILARSLVYTHNYGLMNVAGGPGQAMFPFGYPLVLAGVEAALPGNLDGLRAVSLAATLLTLSLLFWGWPLLSHTTSHWWGLAVASLYAISPLTIAQASIIMSEPVFTCLALGAWLLTEWCQSKRPGSRAATLGALGLGALLAFVSFTRTIGLVFVAVVFVRYAIAFGWQAWRSISLVVVGGLIFTTAIVVLTPVDASDIMSSNSQYVADYLGYAQGTRRYVAQTDIAYGPLVLRRAYRHAVRDVRALLVPVGGGAREAGLFASWGLPFLRDWVGLLIDAVALVGLIQWLRREGLTTFLMALGLYYLAIGFWDWLGTRLLYPIQPQLYFALLLGAHWLVQLVQRRSHLPLKFGQYLAVGLYFCLMAACVYKSFQIDDSRLHTGDLALRTQWINANAAPTAVIMSEQGGIDYLYSRRLTVTFPDVNAASPQVLAYLKQKGVNYVVVAPVLEWQTPYAPAYNSQTQALKPSLDQLVQEKLLKQVAVSGDGWTVTYAVPEP
jgi:hypothetical protein